MGLIAILLIWINYSNCTSVEFVCPTTDKGQSSLSNFSPKPLIAIMKKGARTMSDLDVARPNTNAFREVSWTAIEIRCYRIIAL